MIVTQAAIKRCVRTSYKLVKMYSSIYVLSKCERLRYVRNSYMCGKY